MSANEPGAGALSDAAESETSDHRLRELAPCEGGSHVHADPRSPYACALLREREQRRYEAKQWLVMQKDSDEFTARDRQRIAELERERDQAIAERDAARHEARIETLINTDPEAALGALLAELERGGRT